VARQRRQRPKNYTRICVGVQIEVVGCYAHMAVPLLIGFASWLGSEPKR
jgi:hypothetical protein